MVFFLIAFITTKERILPIVEGKSTVLQDVRDLVKNVPWIIMLLVTVLVFITLALKGGFYIYFFQNYLSAPALAKFLDGIGFNHFISGLNAALHAIGLTEFKWPDDPPTSAFGLFNGSGIIMMIIGIGFSKPLADRFGKRNTFATALFLSTIFVFSFIYFPKDAIALCFISQTLHGFFYGITIPSLWAMTAAWTSWSTTSPPSSRCKDFAELTTQQWDRTFKVNIYSYFWTTKAAYPHLPDGGAVINTASINGLRGNKTLIDYSATKGSDPGPHLLAGPGLRLDRGIRVNSVAPGPVWTPLIPATFDQDKVASFGAQVPMGRAAHPDEIAPSYVFFAAGRMSSYYSGEVLAPVGGETMPG